MRKKEKLVGCQLCPWGKDKEEMFVEPTLVGDKEIPDLIVIAEAPGKTELKRGEPLIGDSGQIIRRMASKLGITVLLMNSAQCYNKSKPDTKVIRACREAYVTPILDKLAGIPILACGEYAASSLLGGTRAIGKLAGKVLRVNTSDVYFTYHPAYYLYSRNPEVLEHISVMMKSAVTKASDRKKPTYVMDLPPKSILDSEHLYIDLETRNELFPWYGSNIACVGICGDKETVYVFPGCKIGWLSWLDDYSGVVVGHNMNFDLVHWFYAGRSFDKASLWDTMIYEKLRPLKEQSVGLKWLLKKRFGFHGYESIVHGAMELDGITPHDMPFESLSEYCATDVYGTKCLHKWQLDELADNPNKAIFSLSMDYLKFVIKMEMNGIFVDKGRLAKFGKENSKKIRKVEREIRKIVQPQIA